MGRLGIAFATLRISSSWPQSQRAIAISGRVRGSDSGAKRSCHGWRFVSLPCEYSMADALMSACALFSLKDPLKNVATTKTSRTWFASAAFPATRRCERFSICSNRICCGRCLTMNKSNVDLRVNSLQYPESAPDGSIRKRFSWVTDLTITRDNTRHLVRRFKPFTRSSSAAAGCARLLRSDFRHCLCDIRTGTRVRFAARWP